MAAFQEGRIILNLSSGTMNVFGPVPSRRLGRSLGVKTVPPNTCTYNCIYCQLGQTTHLISEPKPWYDLDTILEAIARKESQVRDLGESIDYVTFVPNGEPTLDSSLEVEVQILHSVGIRTAIITNASLISRSDVREALQRVDRVSVKVDAVNEAIWRRVNQPHQSLSLNKILGGLIEFAQSYKGTLDTETMLIKNVNDDKASLEQVASFIKRLNPSTAFLSIPMRPPSESWVHSPSEKELTQAYLVFNRHIDNVEYLTAYEGNDFVATGDVETELLAILGVHPMRKKAVRAFIENTAMTWNRVEKLVEHGELLVVFYEGETYYVRRHCQEPKICPE